jgi:hypothetical protein
VIAVGSLIRYLECARGDQSVLEGRLPPSGAHVVRAAFGGLVERLGPPLNTRIRQGGVTFSLSESDLPVSETPPRRYARCPCFRVIFAGRISAPITRRADRPLPLNRAVFSSAECPAAMRFTHSTAPDSCRCSCQSRNRSRTSSSRLGGPMARRRPALPRRRWHSRAKCGPRSGA